MVKSRQNKQQIDTQSSDDIANDFLNMQDDLLSDMELTLDNLEAIAGELEIDFALGGDENLNDNDTLIEEFTVENSGEEEFTSDVLVLEHNEHDDLFELADIDSDIDDLFSTTDVKVDDLFAV